jgi:hypothetical protein
MAITIRLAIRPYSTAVAPDWSAQIFPITLFRIIVTPTDTFLMFHKSSGFLKKRLMLEPMMEKIPT